MWSTRLLWYALLLIDQASASLVVPASCYNYAESAAEVYQSVGVNAAQLCADNGAFETALANLVSCYSAYVTQTSVVTVSALDAPVSICEAYLSGSTASTASTSSPAVTLTSSSRLSSVTSTQATTSSLLLTTAASSVSTASSSPVQTSSSLTSATSVAVSFSSSAVSSAAASVSTQASSIISTASGVSTSSATLVSSTSSKHASSIMLAVTSTTHSTIVSSISSSTTSAAVTRTSEAATTSASRHKNLGLVLGTAIAGTSLLVLMALAIGYCIYRRREKTRKGHSPFSDGFDKYPAQSMEASQAHPLHIIEKARLLSDHLHPVSPDHKGMVVAPILRVSSRDPVHEMDGRPIAYANNPWMNTELPANERVGYELEGSNASADQGRYNYSGGTLTSSWGRYRAYKE